VHTDEYIVPENGDRSWQQIVVGVFVDYKRALCYFDLLWICCTDKSDRHVAVLVVLFTSDAVDDVGFVNNTSASKTLRCASDLTA